MKRLRNIDVILVILTAILCEMFVITPKLNETSVRIIFNLFIILFLPGYSLMAVMFPLRRLSRLKRLLLSVVFSIAIVLLLCLGFSFNPSTIPSVIFILTLSMLTIFLIMISFLRRIRTSNELLEDFEDSTEEKFEAIKLDKTSVKEKSVSKSQFLPADLLPIFLLTFLCIVFVLTPKLNETVIRTILGLLFILFLPGYSLIAALFPKKSDLNGIERASLSFGLSIAVTPLIGLLLNYAPFGIKLTPILISLSVFTIFMSIIAYIRRWKLPYKERFNIKFKYHFNNMTKAFKQESGMNRFLSIVLVISIILAILMTVYAIATPKEGEKFTEFYILGPNGKASDYPTNLIVNEEGKVIISIVNHEYANVNYKIVIKLNNNIINERDITLSNNEKYEEPFTFTASPGEKQKLEFLLYKLPDKNNVYRSLHLWVSVR